MTVQYKYVMHEFSLAICLCKSVWALAAEIYLLVHSLALSHPTRSNDTYTHDVNMCLTTSEPSNRRRRTTKSTHALSLPIRIHIQKGKSDANKYEFVATFCFSYHIFYPVI